MSNSVIFICTGLGSVYTKETTRTVIIIEDTLAGTCSGTCDDIPTPINQKPALLAAPYYCQTVKDCRYWDDRLSVWLSAFYAVQHILLSRNL